MPHRVCFSYEIRAVSYWVERSCYRLDAAIYLRTMDQRRRVVVADDHPRVLIALTRVLEAHVDVVAVAIDGEDLLRKVGNLLPDAVVTDISMPRINGFDACRHIRRVYPAVFVVIVSELLDDVYMSARAF